MTEDLTQELNILIRDQINLPSPPAIAVRILENVQNKDSSMKDLEKIISADPALTGKMLRIANSTFYSLPSEITNAKLEELAFRDGLTGLYNHRYFQETLDREIARVKRYGHPLSLLLFDIDFFKKINDNFGHPAGDQVLINLAQCVSGAMRPTDIIARYGGEEFAVILPETNLAGMKVFAERLRRSTAALTTVVPNNTVQVTISCGGALLAAEDNFSKQDLIDSADRALYLSKQTGRNRTTILPTEAILQKQDLQ